MAEPRDPIADLLHRVNNLLAVIQTQAEVARAIGTPAAGQKALELIADAAARTGQEVRQFRAQRGAGGG